MSKVLLGSQLSDFEIYVNDLRKLSFLLCLVLDSSTEPPSSFSSEDVLNCIDGLLFDISDRLKQLSFDISVFFSSL